MSLLLSAKSKLTMSSREIAEFVGASHDSVLKSLRYLAGRGVIFGNETPYTHPQNGQTYPEFLLDYRNTMVVVSGYSAEVRARIIDRWQALEEQQMPKVPQTLAQALRLAADQAEQIEHQQEQLALAVVSRVEFVDRLQELMQPFVKAAEQAQQTRQTLEIVRLALLAHNYCLVTDRPDLPRSEATSWTINFNRELSLLDDAIGSMNTSPRSPGGSSDQLIEQLSGRATPAQEHRSSHTPAEDHL